MKEIVEIGERSYRIAPLDAEQNRKLWVTPDLTLTVWQQWEGTIESALKNAGNPISKADLARLPYEQMQQLIMRISQLTFAAAQAATSDNAQATH